MHGAILILSKTFHKVVTQLSVFYSSQYLFSLLFIFLFIKYKLPQFFPEVICSENLNTVEVVNKYRHCAQLCSGINKAHEWTKESKIL